MKPRPTAWLAALVFAAPAQAQVDDVGLAARVRAALHDDLATGQRSGILEPLPAPGVFGGPVAPVGPMPPCPACKVKLRQVALGKSGERGFEGATHHWALVCVEDALFFVRVRSVMTSGDAGPFALPDAGVRPERRMMPWGAELLAREKVAVPDGWHPNAQRSADGSLVVGGGHSPSLQVWDGERTLFEDGGPMGVTAMALSDDGSKIALARSMGPLRIVSLASGRQVGRVVVRRANVTGVAFDPSGRRLVFAVMQGGSGPYDIRVAKATGGKSRLLLRLDQDPRHFVWLPATQQLVVAAYGGELHAVALADGKVSWQTDLEFPPEEIAASPDQSRLFATGDGGRHAALLDSRAGTVIREIRIRSLYESDRSTGSAIAWRADGRAFAWTLADGRLALSPTGPNGELRVSLGAADLTMPGGLRLRYATGDQLVTARLDGEQMAWDTAKFVGTR